VHDVQLTTSRINPNVFILHGTAEDKNITNVTKHLPSTWKYSSENMVVILKYFEVFYSTHFHILGPSLQVNLRDGPNVHHCSVCHFSLSRASWIQFIFL